MAKTKVKRPIHRAQPRTTKSSTRQPVKTARRNNRRAQKHTASKNKQLLPGSLALTERTLPSRRFVDFPQVVGKTIKRLHIYTATDYNCVTIDLDDLTTLNLAIEPGFVINAELQHINKGNIEIIAEWPAIPSQQ